MDVYINDLAIFLPNDPINNEEIENVLGKINNIRSRVKRIVLKNNKGTEDNRVRKLDYSIQLSKLFYKP